MLIINAIRKGEERLFSEILAKNLEMESDPDGSAADFVLQMLHESRKEFLILKIKARHEKELKLLREQTNDR